MKVYDTKLEGIQKLTEAEYAALQPPVADVLYIVAGDTNFQLYLGTLPLASGAGEKSIGILTAYLLGITGTVGTIQTIETEE